MEVRAKISKTVMVELDLQNCVVAMRKEWCLKVSKDPCASIEGGRWMLTIIGANGDYIGEMGEEFLREATQEELEIDAAFKTLMAAFEK